MLNNSLEAMPLASHFVELKKRLITIILSVLGFFTLSYVFIGPLFSYLLWPLDVAKNATPNLIFTEVHEAFFTQIKLSFIIALYAAMPIISYQIWSFISPGLYDGEKKFTWPMLLLAPVLFYAGGAVCFYFVLPVVIEFFFAFQTELVTALPTMKAYLSFCTKLCFAFGLAFQLPLILILLLKLEVISVAKLNYFRRYAVLLIFVFAAIFTPPDPTSQLLLAVPMWLLYEVAIICGYFIEKRRKASSSLA